jgi:primase-polymerase (primpol)-like protein
MLGPQTEYHHNGKFTSTTTPVLRVAVEPNGVYDELKARRQWVVHRHKEPFCPTTQLRASTTDLTTWAAFEDAIAGLETGRYDGIGFVFCSADPYVGIDLDDCRDPEAGTMSPWAAKVVEAFPNAYREISPSGRGVHIITRGKAPSRKRTGLEIYSAGRYFTVTGRVL